MKRLLASLCAVPLLLTGAYAYAATNSVPVLSSVIAADEDPLDDVADDELDTPKKKDEFAVPVKKDELDDEAEETPPPKKKDEFAVVPVEEPKVKDEFVLEKRDAEAQEYQEPEIAVVSQSTFLYTEDSTLSKRLFELYKGDELAVFEERGDWVKVEFLGKEGWVERNAISFSRYAVYRLTADLSIGMAYGTESLRDYTVLGSYSLMGLWSFGDWVGIGIEGRGISVDADVIYAGVGAGIKGYIPYLETKKSKTSITLSGGYLWMQDIPGYKELFLSQKGDALAFKSGYFTAAIEHTVRLADIFYLGAGFEFTYVGGSSETASGEKISRSFMTAGGRIKFLFNLFR